MRPENVNWISLISPTELCGNKNNYRFIKNCCKITRNSFQWIVVTILAIISIKPGKAAKQNTCKSSRCVSWMQKVVSFNVHNLNSQFLSVSAKTLQVNRTRYSQQSNVFGILISLVFRGAWARQKSLTAHGSVVVYSLNSYSANSEQNSTH